MSDLGGLLEGADVNVDADLNLAFDWGPIGIIIGGVLAFLLVVFVIAYFCGRGMCRCCDYTCCKGEALQSSKRRNENQLRRDYMATLTANNSHQNSHFDPYNRTLPTTIKVDGPQNRPQDLVVYQNHQMAYIQPPFKPYQSFPYQFQKREHPFGSHRALPLPVTSYQHSQPTTSSRNGDRQRKRERKYHIPNHSSYI
ncbi:Oidioi.mRNA.OKI2018_I69.PAR.g11632.t1.cds [Oikopleura dioica]|uniref:Oidioi.mRNA.OKI2018_I69.PAR.g11632.t1.cds n=1 Tax=Oikopleura dioica TaxID=34765 RepID=A0ABN7S0S1_OIKDI|nr:Oidioi.mRNA.OKI2018_I69.PAR.g11632.t1.cds [Oikopleura dioica]